MAYEIQRIDLTGAYGTRVVSQHRWRWTAKLACLFKGGEEHDRLAVYVVVPQVIAQTVKVSRPEIVVQIKTKTYMPGDA